MKVLLLSPHTDDIELGAGGAITKLLEENCKIIWVVFSTCEDAVPEGSPSDTLKKEFLSVVSNLGIDEYRVYDFENKNFPAYRGKILNQLVQIKKNFDPDLVICPSLADFHQDHKTISEEAVRIFKKDVKIIGFELPWNNLIFKPQLFVRLTKKHADKKWEILSLYKSQFIKQRNYFSKEFIYGWAKMRGIQCNAEYAEAFEVMRWMI